MFSTRKVYVPIDVKFLEDAGVTNSVRVLLYNNIWCMGWVLRKSTVLLQCGIQGLAEISFSS